MAKLHGKTGDVRIDANQVGEVGSWSGDLAIGLVETTALQDAYMEHLAGPVGMTGTIEVFWDSTDTNGQVAMMTAVITPATVNLYLYEDATHYFYMKAYLEAGTVVSIADAVKRTYSFTSTGKMTYV